MTVQFCPKILAGSDKSFRLNDFFMVEAAGVEPDISVENTQLTDSRNASFAGNAVISKSTIRSLYSDCQQFPEPQPSDLLLQMRDTLKCSATFIHQSDPENRLRDQASVFHASRQREGELDMPKDSGDVTALQLLDTPGVSRVSACGKIVPHSLRHRPRALQRCFNDLDYYLEIFIVLKLTLANPNGSIALAS